MTVKGILMGIVPIAMIILKSVGHEIDNDLLQQIVDVITNIVATFATIVAAVVSLWGLIRKVWNGVKQNAPTDSTVSDGSSPQ